MPWAVGNDAAPEQAGVPAAVPIAVAAALPVRVMVVFDYARCKDQDAALTEIRDVFLKALPGISVAMRGCWGPFGALALSLLPPPSPNSIPGRYHRKSQWEYIAS